MWSTTNRNPFWVRSMTEHDLSAARPHVDRDRMPDAGRPEPAVAGEPAFLTYGSRFAQLLELPEQPISGVPITRQLPGRYLRLFTEGCSDAIAQAAPVRLRGAVVDYGQIELYRAAFMPLAMQPNSSMQAVFGTFNRRIGPEAYSSEAFRTTYNWLSENVQS